MTTARAGSGPMLYNPALLSREDLIATFVVRQAELAELLDRVRSAPREHAPQHVLVLGWRGMGKTTLLHRVAYAVEEDRELRDEWLPVLFEEEQLNVGELADFWLNALDMLAVAADDRALEEQAARLARERRGQDLEEAAYELLAASAKRLGKRLLLLVDNVDLVLTRIDPDREASRLREVLQHEPWLMLIGASSQAIEATYDYGQPFYEMFRVLELGPLDERQTLDMLAALADRFDAPDVARVIREDPDKIRKLRLLMGGNPRTVGLLFGVLQEGPTSDFRSQLERLLDSSTSLYKDRLESLPVQTQRVFVALAQRWDPATAADVADDLRISRGVASGQLHRLVDRGLVEKVRLRRRAIGFQVRERFFNIWWLMRGGRRSRERLRWLIEAIDLFFDAERLAAETQKVVASLATSIDLHAIRQIEFGAALVQAIPGTADRAGLVLALLKALAALPADRRPNVIDWADLSVLQQELSDEEAVALAREAIEAGFVDVEILTHAANLLLTAAQWEGLRSLAQSYVGDRDDEPLAWQLLGVAAFFLDDLSDAEEAATRSLELSPLDPLSWELSANLDLITSDFEGARSKIKAGLEASPLDGPLSLSALAVGVEFDPAALGDLNAADYGTRPVLPATLYGMTYLGLIASIATGSDELARDIFDTLKYAAARQRAYHSLIVPLLFIAAGYDGLVADALESDPFAASADLIRPLLRQTGVEVAPEKSLASARLVRYVEAMTLQFDSLRPSFKGLNPSPDDASQT